MTQDITKGRNKLMKKYKKIMTATVEGVLAAGAAIAEYWDMPMA